MKRAAGFILSFLLLFLTPCAGLADGGVPQKVLDLRKSVVRVVCRASDSISTGSGFAIGRDVPVKYVVTNLHVVEANPGGVSILRENNREIGAKAYLQLPDADLCVLLLDEALYNVPPVTLKDDAPADVGQAVYTLGFPGAADDLTGTMTGDPEDVTITDGIVSAVKTMTFTEKGPLVSLLQINAAINHGNSGGPLVDGEGRVLGVNALGATDAQNINGAIGILELTGALKDRNIAYLSSGGGARPGFPYLTVLVVSGSVIVAALGVLLILWALRLRGAKKRGDGGVPLPEYLGQWGGRLPYDTAVRVLEPALRELAGMHAAGRAHGDVCPETVFVGADTNRARLGAPESAVGNRITLRPGFSSPEQHRADGRVGPWSDVYSVCAVFYYAVTGKRPPGVVERQALGGVGAFGFGDANIGQAQGSAILSGLALEAGLRPQSAGELICALGLGDAAAAPGLDAPALPYRAVPAGARPPRKRMRTGKKLLIAGLSALLVLCAGAGGFYLYNDAKYNEAVACISKQDYEGGIRNLMCVLSIFKSANEWMMYACGGDALQQNDFVNARNAFKSLGDFNRADEMLKEVDYLQAYYILSKGDYQNARNLFQSLGQYKDSAQMILETDYQKALNFMQIKDYTKASNLFKELSGKKYKDSDVMIKEIEYIWALSYLDEKNYRVALEKLKSINPYKDSAAYIDAITKEAYNEAISMYKNNRFATAKDLFNLVNPYFDAQSYLYLIQAHETNADQAMRNYSETKTLYNNILKNIYLEDAESLLTSDIFLLYRIEGAWISDDRKTGFVLKYDNGIKDWEINMLQSGEKEPLRIHLSGLSIQGNSLASSKGKFISFYFSDYDNMTISFLDEFTFKMKRLNTN